MYSVLSSNFWGVFRLPFFSAKLPPLCTWRMDHRNQCFSHDPQRVSGRWWETCFKLTGHFLIGVQAENRTVWAECRLKVLPAWHVTGSRTWGRCPSLGDGSPARSQRCRVLAENVTSRLEEVRGDSSIRVIVTVCLMCCLGNFLPINEIKQAFFCFTWAGLKTDVLFL